MKFTNKNRRLSPRSLAIVGLLGAGHFACIDSAIKCTRGLTRCGVGCADFSVDKFNCGVCGTSCQLNQTCQNGKCQCLPGAVLCDGTCAFIASDPRHCGGCADAGGTSCRVGEVCQLDTDSGRGQCRSSCTLGYSNCGDAGACVDLQADPNNCSACDLACTPGARCRAGTCAYDVFAACADAGTVVGVQSPADIRGPAMALGSSPRALGVSGGVLLSADDRDNVLYQAHLPDLSPLGGAKRLGQGPRQLLVSPPFVYVVNEQSNTLQIFQLDAGERIDAGVAFGDGGPPSSADGGVPLSLGLQSEFAFDAGAFPQTVAAVSSNLFVSLYGGEVASDGGIGMAASGQQLARIDSSNPAQPFLVESIFLDGGATLARPTGVLAHGGSIYVALSNLTFADAPAGPGTLAKIDTSSGGVQSIDLGDCFRPQWLAESGDLLVVSCSGNGPRALSDGGVADAGPPAASELVLLNGSDQVISSWRASCPLPADPGCLRPALSRFALVGSRIYAGDLQDGRLFVVEIVGDQLVERRGLSSDAGPIQICRGVAITDVVSIP